jgi:hypothetical protein
MRETSPDDEMDGIATIFRRIERDASTVFQDLKIFHRGGPLYDDLITVTKAYAFYRSDFGYVRGTHAVAATFLINLSPFASFVAIVNSLNRPLPLAFLTDDTMAVFRLLTFLTVETQILHRLRTFILHQFKFAPYLFHIYTTTPSINLPRQNDAIAVCTAYAIGYFIADLGYICIRGGLYPPPRGCSGIVALRGEVVR